jgi:hypothetical protein
MLSAGCGFGYVLLWSSASASALSFAKFLAFSLPSFSTLRIEEVFLSSLSDSANFFLICDLNTF